MNSPHTHRRQDRDDAWLDALLRADAAGQGFPDDDGFTARVMARLPVRRPPVWGWLAPALGALGAVGALAWGVPLTALWALPTNLAHADPQTLLRAALPMLAVAAGLASAAFVSLAETH